MTKKISLRRITYVVCMMTVRILGTQDFDLRALPGGRAGLEETYLTTMPTSPLTLRPSACKVPPSQDATIFFLLPGGRTPLSISLFLTVRRCENIFGTPCLHPLTQVEIPSAVRKPLRERLHPHAAPDSRLSWPSVGRHHPSPPTILVLQSRNSTFGLEITPDKSDLALEI